MLPEHLKNSTYISSNVMEAMGKVTVPVSPHLVQELKNHTSSVLTASGCMNSAQTMLNLPVMARLFPTTFARMMYTSLSANEEHEPDFEDQEGELFWPGQCITGEGLGWVCLMGKAMINEFGKAYGYKGLDGVVPKPKPAAPAPVQR